MSQEPNLVEIWKSRLPAQGISNFSKNVSDLALIPGADKREQGAKSRQNLKIKITSMKLTTSKNNMRLGAYSGAGMREPGAKARRNLEITITSIRH